MDEARWRQRITKAWLVRRGAVVEQFVVVRVATVLTSRARVEFVRSVTVRAEVDLPAMTEPRRRSGGADRCPQGSVDEPACRAVGTLAVDAART